MPASDLRPAVAAGATRAELTQIVLPQYTNAIGTIFGGQVAAWIDMCAAISAQRFCRTQVVTVSIDELHFLHPIQRGHIAIFRSTVNAAWNRSIEVGVRVEGEDPLTGERTHTASAYTTFVSLVEGRTTLVPRLLVETPDEHRRLAEAELRRNSRLRHRAELESRRS